MTAQDRIDPERFRDLIRARTGLAVPAARAADLERTIVRALPGSGHRDSSSLFDALSRSEPSEAVWESFLSALNIGETHFFRDPNQIQALRSSILPRLIRDRSAARRLRIWSAGCSTGEEPYTLAIMIRQLIPEISSWDVLVMGTDINSSALARARRGLYRDWSFRGAPASGLERWIQRNGDFNEVASSIRQMVKFEQLNLTDPAGLPEAVAPFDLVLCRNVLLYFDQDRARSVVRRLAASLAADGCLMVSRVDAGLPVFHDLHTSHPGSGIFTRPRAKPTEGLDGPKSSVARSGRIAPSARSEPRRVRPTVGASEAARDPRAAKVNPADRRQAAASATATPVPDESSSFEFALAAWERSDEARAAHLVESSLARDPFDPRLHYLRGLILLDDHDLPGAMDAFRRATYADPGFVLAHLGLGSVLARRGDPRRARASLEIAARLAAELEPEEKVVAEDRLTAADVLELIAAERSLLDLNAGALR